MENTLNNIDKGPRDIIFVLAHSTGGDFVKNANISQSRKDLLFNKADFLCAATIHMFQRWSDYDGQYPNGAVNFNSGSLGNTGSTSGYMEFHVFDNPPRFTIQYLSAQDYNERTLHDGRIPHIDNNVDDKSTCVPHLKIIDGPYSVIEDWSTFVTTPPSNSAGFVSQNIPAEMDLGESFNAEIIMKNKGADTWTSAKGHRLGSRNALNNTTWGVSSVDVVGTAATNENYTFSFDITAPTTAGLYNFQWKMRDITGENTGWFGDETLNAVVNVGNLYDTTSDPGTVTDNGVNVPSGETSDNAIDDTTDSKFLSFSLSAYLQYQYAAGDKKRVVAVTMTSGGDAPERDPSEVLLTGSQDGNNWTPIHTETGITFSSRGEKIGFNVNNTTAYEYYRLEMSCDNGKDDIIQIDEIEFLSAVNFPPWEQ